MSVVIYEWVRPDPADRTGGRVKEDETFKAWLGERTAKHRSWLQARINHIRQLANVEDAVDLKLLEGPVSERGIKYRHLWKIKSGTSTALRPMACKGPQNPQAEVTILVGAIEIQHRLKPPPSVAEARRLEVAADERRRRKFGA
jgi:hypothetical protein